MNNNTEEELQPPKSFLEREYKFILLILFIALVGVAGMMYLLMRKVDNGLRNDFKKVEKLSREVYVFHTLPVTDIFLLAQNLNTRKSHMVCPLPDYNYYYFRSPLDYIGIYVDGKKFYVASSKTKILTGNVETLEVEETIDFEPYNLPGVVYPAFIYSHNHEIWVSYYFDSGSSDETDTEKYLLNKFNIKKRTFRKTGYRLDCDSNMAMKKIKPSDQSYFMSINGIIEAPDSSPGTYDYDAEYGWLKSWYKSDFKRSNSFHIEKSQKAGKIIWYKPGEKDGIELIDGYNAFWGYDGNIYFVRNGSELWMYDMKYEKCSPIYLPTSPDWAYRPKLSRDRTLLALPCKTWSSINYMVFDLKNKECMELGLLHSFTWCDNKVTSSPGLDQKYRPKRRPFKRWKN